MEYRHFQVEDHQFQHTDWDIRLMCLILNLDARGGEVLLILKMRLSADGNCLVQLHCGTGLTVCSLHTGYSVKYAVATLNKFFKRKHYLH